MPPNISPNQSSSRWPSLEDIFLVIFKSLIVSLITFCATFTLPWIFAIAEYMTHGDDPSEQAAAAADSQFKILTIATTILIAMVVTWLFTSFSKPGSWGASKDGKIYTIIFCVIVAAFPVFFLINTLYCPHSTTLLYCTHDEMYYLGGGQ